MVKLRLEQITEACDVECAWMLPIDLINLRFVNTQFASRLIQKETEDETDLVSKNRASS